jgi:hypothetical protein
MRFGNAESFFSSASDCALLLPGRRAATRRKAGSFIVNGIELIKLWWILAFVILSALLTSRQYGGNFSSQSFSQDELSHAPRDVRLGQLFFRLEEHLRRL